MKLIQCENMENGFQMIIIFNSIRVASKTVARVTRL